MNYFNKKDIIDQKYEILFFIHQTTYGWSYRVKGLENGKILVNGTQLLVKLPLLQKKLDTLNFLYNDLMYRIN